MCAASKASSFQRVAIVDDDVAGRASYCDPIEDMNSIAVPEDGPLGELTGYISALKARADAALCDYHLKKSSNYSRFDGDKLAAELYVNQMPAVLCTRYSNWESSLLRSRRRYIPYVISYHEAEPDIIRTAFTACMQEFAGEFEVRRQPWRALVRVEEYDADLDAFYVVVPSWDAEIRICLHSVDLPQSKHAEAKAGDYRCHAMVNLGAEREEELFLVDWEV